MRLTCPNCGAQYEVPDDVMPVEGRDVQCSNCGTTWFQEHPDHAAHPSSDPQTVAQEDEEVAAFDAPSDLPEPQPAEIDPHEEPEIRPAPKPPASDTPPKRRELDPAVADVLRAEAELEEKARQNETVSVESQPELGLESATPDAKRRAREARDRMARMRGEPTPTSQGASETPLSEGAASRRDLLPDIEEINSTLRSNNDRTPGSDPGQTAQVEFQEKRSSIRGFTLTVLFVSALALLYVFAPQLSEMVPQAGGVLDTYVSMIDRWRAWLDTQVVAMLSWLDAAAASSAE